MLVIFTALMASASLGTAAYLILTGDDPVAIALLIGVALFNTLMSMWNISLGRITR